MFVGTGFAPRANYSPGQSIFHAFDMLVNPLKGLGTSVNQAINQESNSMTSKKEAGRKPLRRLDNDQKLRPSRVQECAVEHYRAEDEHGNVSILPSEGASGSKAALGSKAGSKAARGNKAARSTLTGSPATKNPTLDSTAVTQSSTLQINSKRQFNTTVENKDGSATQLATTERKKKRKEKLVVFNQSPTSPIPVNGAVYNDSRSAETEGTGTPRPDEPDEKSTPDNSMTENKDAANADLESGSEEGTTSETDPAAVSAHANVLCPLPLAYAFIVPLS